MRAVLRHRIPFNASHTVEVANVTCGEYLHGHDWYAEIEVVGQPDIETGLFLSEGPEELARLVSELHKRDMNELLPGVHPTAAGCAGWIVERLRMSTPGLSRVTVGFREHSVSLEI